jgi:LAO/AO transport system kinase
MTKRTFSVDELADGILRHREHIQHAPSRRALAKAISLVESTLPRDQEHAQALLERLLPHTGGAVRLGITGVPGVGKSTFIEALGMMLLADTRSRSHTLATLAIDPSSARSGGSILGDKTRMTHLARADRAFIRPSPSAGSLGGVARRTRETMLLCEAAGFSIIIVETVGVGQSETTVASMVDMFLMLLLPNAGDELQGMKRGIMELADAFIINKADTDTQAAERAARHIQNATHLSLPKYPDWQPPVLLASALRGDGLASVWAACEQFAAERQRIEDLRRKQAVRWMNDAVDEGLRAMLHASPALAEHWHALEADVLAARRTPHAASDALLAALKASLRDSAEAR